jgi:hypothetical protein
LLVEHHQRSLLTLTHRHRLCLLFDVNLCRAEACMQRWT